MAGEKKTEGGQEVGRLKVWLRVGGGDSLAFGRKGSWEYGEVFFFVTKIMMWANNFFLDIIKAILMFGYLTTHDENGQSGVPKKSIKTVRLRKQKLKII